jgi:hypothetical protein
MARVRSTTHPCDDALCTRAKVLSQKGVPLTKAKIALGQLKEPSQCVQVTRVLRAMLKVIPTEAPIPATIISAP